MTNYKKTTTVLTESDRIYTSLHYITLKCDGLVYPRLEEQKGKEALKHQPVAFMQIS